MGRKRRVSKRRADLTEQQIAWLAGDYENAGFTNYIHDDELSDLWNRYVDSIIEEHIIENPGTRPGRWWKYTAPELRNRLGGVGTPAMEVLEIYNPRVRYGIPVDWINAFDVAFYTGPAPTNYGNRALPKAPGNFNGVAIDQNDPPIFESEAAYLKRLGLFMPGEAKRLTKADFEPDRIISN